MYRTSVLQQTPHYHPLRYRKGCAYRGSALYSTSLSSPTMYSLLPMTAMPAGSGSLAAPKLLVVPTRVARPVDVFTRYRASFCFPAIYSVLPLKARPAGRFRRRQN